MEADTPGGGTYPLYKLSFYFAFAYELRCCKLLFSGESKELDVAAPPPLAELPPIGPDVG